MPLFKVGDKPIKKLKIKKFDTEYELHQLFKENLETLLGVKFLESEYKFKEGRIDTLGIDDNGFPVVIEYKKGKSSDVILQALFYTNWLADHKGDFQVLADEKMGEKAKIDWGNIRVIIIANEFNKWDKFAIQQMDRPVELIEYKLYENGNLYLESEVLIEEQKEDIGRPEGMEEYIKRRKPKENIKILFNELIEKIDQISDDIRKIIAKSVISYRTSRNFTSVQLQKSQITIHLTFSELPKDRSIFTLIEEERNHCHLKISSNEELPMAMELIIKAYEDSL